MIDASLFAGRTFVVRIDHGPIDSHTTLPDDLRVLRQHGVRPIVVAPSSESAREHVRALNRFGDFAVGLSGADAALLPSVGRVQPRILVTLTEAGYVPVIEPYGLDISGREVAMPADDVAVAIAAATDAVRALFFHEAGGVYDPETSSTIGELTPGEALAIADREDLASDIRATVRAAARGVRAGIGAAQILDGRIAHAAIIELLTTIHIGTQVAGTVLACDRRAGAPVIPPRVLCVAACAGVIAASPNPGVTIAPPPLSTSAATGGIPLGAPPVPAATSPATPEPAPDAIAPPDAVEFDVKLTGFRAGFDVTLNGRLIGRMIDSTSEASATSAVKHGLNHLHVRWFSEGQPSAGSLAIRSRKLPTDSWHYVVKIRKYPFSPADGEGDATFEFDPPTAVPAVMRPSTSAAGHV